LAFKADGTNEFLWFISKAGDKNQITGISFSPDGSKGLVFGGEVLIANTYPVWFIIDMANGAINLTGNGNLRISLGFLGKCVTYGGYFVSSTEYVV